MNSFTDRDGFIWFNGKLVDWRDANFHILNHGLHYGSSVFEGLRAYNGKPFELTRHNERLHKSANTLGFKIPYTVEELDKATYQVMEANNLTDCYIRPFAFLGGEKMGVVPTGNSVQTAIAVWDDWTKYFSPELYEKGMRLCLADWKRPSPETAPVQSKAAGLYMIASMSKVSATKQGYDDALMLDYQGNVSEITAGNIFFVFNGELHTPTADCFLNGITRQTIMKLAEQNNIKVVERIISLEEIKNATEVFVTGSAAEVVPICEADGNKYETVGKITRLLGDEYSKFARS